MPVHFLTDWMDDSSGEVAPWVGERIGQLPSGSIVMLENARFWPLETSLWRPRPRDLESLLPRLTGYAQSVRRELGKVHINEGFAASNCDLSSALVPQAMDRVALGHHVAAELEGPVLAARSAEIVVFSGAKFNKLDDLAGVISQGRVKLVIAGGLLALPLLSHCNTDCNNDCNTDCHPKSATTATPTQFEMGRAGEVPTSAMSVAKQVVQAIRDRGPSCCCQSTSSWKTGRLLNEFLLAVRIATWGPKPCNGSKSDCRDTRSSVRERYCFTTAC